MSLILTKKLKLITNMISKITKKRLNVATNNLEKQVTIYYFFFIPIFKMVEEVVEEL
jgi:hypothetical protein